MTQSNEVGAGVGDVNGENLEGAPSLRASALVGGRWGAAGSVAEQALSTIGTIVLARLLSPEDFGLVAIAGVIVGMLTLVAQFGFTASLVQRPTAPESALSTTFWLSLLIGVIATGITAGLSGPLASSFGRSDAGPLVGVLALVVGIGLAHSVPRALLQRDLRFRALALVGILNAAVYVASAVVLAAVWDAGAWSVVIGKVLGAAAASVAVWVAASWRPRLLFHWGSISGDLAFNAGFFGNRILSYLSKNVDYWAVGRLVGDAGLGTYYISFVVPNVIRQRMTTAAQKTLFPVFSRIAGERERLARAYTAGLRFVALIAVPALVGLAMVADLAVPVLLGSQWGEAVEPMMIVSVAAAFETLYPVSAALFLSLGRPMMNMALNGLRLVALAVGLWIASYFDGLAPFALAVLGSAVVVLMVSQLVAARMIRLSAGSLMQALLPLAIPLFAEAAAVLGIRYLSDRAGLGNIGTLAVVALGGGSIYLVTGVAVHKKAFRQLLRDLRTSLGLGGSRDRS